MVIRCWLKLRRKPNPACILQRLASGILNPMRKSTAHRAGFADRAAKRTRKTIRVIREIRGCFWFSSSPIRPWIDTDFTDKRAVTVGFWQARGFPGSKFPGMPHPIFRVCPW
jgi:hypothetical protein